VATVITPAECSVSQQDSLLPALAWTLYPGKTGHLQSNLIKSRLNNWLYLQLFMWHPRSHQVNT